MPNMQLTNIKSSVGLGWPLAPKANPHSGRMPVRVRGLLHRPAEGVRSAPLGQPINPEAEGSQVHQNLQLELGLAASANQSAPLQPLANQSASPPSPQPIGALPSSPQPVRALACRPWSCSWTCTACGSTCQWPRRHSRPLCRSLRRWSADGAPSAGHKPTRALPSHPLPIRARPSSPLPVRARPSSPLPVRALPSSPLPVRALPSSPLPIRALPSSPLS